VDDTPETMVNLLRLVDGTLIDPLTRKPVGESTPPLAQSDESEPDPTVPTVADIRPQVRRSLLDLKLKPQQMAYINNVLVYSLWGLPDDEIAMQCNCELSDVLTVRDMTEYKDMHDALVDGIRSSYSTTAQGILADASVHAAAIVVDTLKSKSVKMRFDAAKDVLDRNGHRPADRANLALNINGFDDELVIRVVRESERPSIPTLNVKPNA
jgi:hypothetical protein